MFHFSITAIPLLFTNVFLQERNVSWLLFACLMTKMFGVARSRHEISAKNKMTAKMFFRKYPSLFEFFISRLREIGDWQKDDAHARSSVYPILLVFARLELHPGVSHKQYDTFEVKYTTPFSPYTDCVHSPWHFPNTYSSQFRRIILHS